MESGVPPPAVAGVAAAAPAHSQAALRWRLVKRALLPSSTSSEAVIDKDLSRVSRRPAGSFNLLPKRLLAVPKQNTSRPAEGSDESNEDGLEIEFSLPSTSSSSADVKLIVAQRSSGSLQLRDLEACQRNSIDSTGISCLWPAEEVLAFFCISHPQLFKNKRVVELGSGYGLAGLAVAACTEAAEVVITDGNPLVMDYVRRSIRANFSTFNETIASEFLLYWGRDLTSLGGRTFDLVIAADCTFFKDFHDDLACTIKSLLHSEDSRALLFNPRRGDTMELFVDAAGRAGLAVEVTEHYDSRVWSVHQQLLKGGDALGWPNYDADHCYPLLVTVRIAS